MVKYHQALSIIDDYDFELKTISIDSFDSRGYVLAKDYTSNINVPSFRKSAMDGYAVTADADLDSPFTIIDTIYAGDQKNPQVSVNQCVKIMTGAPLPDDCDQVIVQELAKCENSIVTFSIPNTKLNPNVCQIGEDIKLGQKLFTSGTVITSTVISSLISCGIFTVEVYQKPSILLVTTGDEVVNDNSNLARGQIYNSNLGYLKSRLVELGFKADTVHLTDQINNVNNLFKTDYDLIITTGAISVGERDIVRKYIQENNPTILFDRVNIMPGGPVVFWEYNQTPIISLAGSPFANFVTFELFARRILAHLTNDQSLIVHPQQMVLTDNYQKTIKKRRFVKAQIINNQVTIPATNHLASSMHEMTLCNCLINLERGEHDIKPGTLVTVLDIRRNYE